MVVCLRYENAFPQPHQPDRLQLNERESRLGEAASSRQLKDCLARDEVFKPFFCQAIHERLVVRPQRDAQLNTESNKRGVFWIDVSA